MLHVHGIKPDDRGEQPDVCFCDVCAVVIWSFTFLRLGSEMGFCAVEGGEQWVDGFFICLLRGGEAGFVHAVVDVVVGPFVGGFDVGAEVFGEEIVGGVFGGENVVELSIEHADDFGGLDGDGRVRGCIIANGSSISFAERRVVRGGMGPYLIADNLILLFIIQRRDRKAPRVIGIDIEVYIS